MQEGRVFFIPERIKAAVLHGGLNDHDQYNEMTKEPDNNGDGWRNFPNAHSGQVLLIV